MDEAKIFQYFFVVLGLFAGGALCLVPRRAIYILLIFSLAIVGPLQFFIPSLAAARWSIQLLSIAILFVALFAVPVKKPSVIPMPIWFLFIFLGSICITTVVNGNYIEALVELKNYIAFFSFPFFFWVLADKKHADFIPKFLLLLAFIQVPLAVLQYYFFNKASGLMPGDIVSGTFGGVMMGTGGPNAEMSLFMIFSIIFVLLLWSREHISLRAFLCMSLVLIIPVLYTNAKAMVLFMALAYAIVFPDLMKRKRRNSIVMTIIFSLLISVTFAYHYSDRSNYVKRKVYAADSVSEYIDDMLKYNIQSDSEDDLNRIGVLLFWIDQHSINDNIIEMMFGHGIGAVKLSGLSSGRLVSFGKYKGYNLGATALPKLLWEVGLLGTFLFLGVFLSAWWQSKNVGKLIKSSRNGALFEVSRVFCLLALVIFLYKRSYFACQVFNTLVMVYLAYVVYYIKMNLDEGTIIE